MKEQQIQKQILDYLNGLPRCKAVKVIQSNERGTPDILGCIDGRPFVLEVKGPNGLLSDAQRVQLGRWRRAGAVADVVWCVDDVIGLFEAEGLLGDDK